jgi:NarL family two-component system response regulator LiaR
MYEVVAGRGEHSDGMQIRRVVAVDEHRMFAEALAMTLSGEADVRVVATFSPAEPDLAGKIRTIRPDVVTVDVEPFAVAAAGALIEQLTRRDPELRVIVLTGVREPRLVVEAARAGALAWLSKEAPTIELLATIRAVCAGHARYPTEQLGVVLRELVGELRRAGGAADSGPLAALSGQERRILAAMVDGERGPQIAARLHLSVGTVRTHTQNIFGKLGVHSRLEAVTLARRAGLLPDVALCDA